MINLAATSGVSNNASYIQQLLFGPNAGNANNANNSFAPNSFASLLRPQAPTDSFRPNTGGLTSPFGPPPQPQAPTDSFTLSSDASTSPFGPPPPFSDAGGYKFTNTQSSTKKSAFEAKKAEIDAQIKEMGPEQLLAEVQSGKITIKTPPNPNGEGQEGQEGLEGELTSEQQAKHIAERQQARAFLLSQSGEELQALAQQGLLVPERPQRPQGTAKTSQFYSTANVTTPTTVDSTAQDLYFPAGFPLVS